MVTEVTLNWKKIRRALRNIRSWSLMSVRCGCSLPVWRKPLQYSHVKPAGGRAYCAVKRLIDIVVSFLALVLLAVPMGVVALVILRRTAAIRFFLRSV